MRLVTMSKHHLALLQPPHCPYHMASVSQQLISRHINLIGFGFDGTACFRKGTRKGPDALRLISDGIESYSPYLDADLEDINFYDLGNLTIDETQSAEVQWQSASENFNTLVDTTDIKAHDTQILTLGGEHSISYAPITNYLKAYDDLVIVHLDAHADLRDGYEGFHYSHASIIRRVVDQMQTNHQLIQYGIRSGTREEYQWMRESNTLCTSQQDFFTAIDAIPNNRPIYLTLDLDYFDPSFFPGTGTPEPGGEDFHSFVALCKRLFNKRLVGADVVELSPEIDQTGNSSVFAAKVVRELVLCLANKENADV